MFQIGWNLLEAAARGEEESMEGDGAIHQYSCPSRIFKVILDELNKNFVTAALASLRTDCDILRRSVMTALRWRHPPREVS